MMERKEEFGCERAGERQRGQEGWEARKGERLFRVGASAEDNHVPALVGRDGKSSGHSVSGRVAA